MFPLDLDRVRDNARLADTEDLLDRVTVFRTGMEAEAIEILEEELHRRGVSAADIVDHGRLRAGDVLFMPDGIAVQCNFCRRPAIERRWDWHWLLGLVPVFPRRLARCREHLQRRSLWQKEPTEQATS
jgi:hypothetical protein